MSLNGLDTAPVKEAYNNATTEAAGWFLLKYISRDVVELLGSGIAGVNEAKAVVTDYEEKSPLYGLIMFRRRKVLIKYVPEGTTRLLQARTTVHFQDVLEKFSPHEALLEITNADSLNDTSLAAAFPLHAGASAVSNIKLDEIAEDAEETSSPPRPRGPQQAPSLSSMSSRKAALERSAVYKRSASASTAPPPVLRVTSDDGQITESSDGGDYDAATERKEEVNPSVSQPLPSPPTAQAAAFESFNGIQHSPDLSRPWEHTRQLSKETIDLYQYPELYKPKIKLGPRPVNVSDKRRGPHTSNANGRPTSTLPAGMQVRTKSTDSATLLQTPEVVQKPVDSPMSPDVVSVPTIPPPPPIPVTPEDSYPPRPSSRGSARSTPTGRSKGAMTPEKQRLLKAVEMRKKQLRKSQPGQKAPVVNPPLPDAVTTVKQEATSGLAPTNLHNQGSVSTQGARKSDSGVDMGYDEHADPQDSAAEDKRSVELPRRHISKLFQPKENTYSGLEPTPISTMDDVDSIVTNEHARSNDTQSKKDPTEEKPTQNTQPATEPEPFIASTAETGTKTPIESVHEDEPDDAPTTFNTPERDSIGNHRTDEQQKRRQGLVMPVTLDQGLFEDKDTEHFSDDDLIDELQNATVHEAEPMAVCKSPATAVFARRPSLISRNSSPSVRSHGSPKSTVSQRTASETFVTEPSSSNAVNPETPKRLRLQRSISELSPSQQSENELLLSASRKNSIQPGISKRIDDLAERRSKHSNGSSNASFTLFPNVTPPAEEQDKELTLRGSTDNDSTIMRDRLRSHGMLPFPRQSSSNRSLSNGQGSNGAVYTVQQNPNNRRDSVSVTARIVRAEQSDESPTKSSELHQSPITINHQRAAAPQTPVQPMGPVLADIKTDTPPHNDNMLSPTSQRDGSISPTLSRKSVEGKRKSFSRYQRRTSTVSGTHSEMPTMEEEPSKPGRASRFLKRMSGLGSRKKSNVSTKEMSSQRSIMGDSIAEGPAEQKDVPPAVVVGDVNVHFPDTGLWKRRLVEIDDAGYVVFTGSKYRFEMGSTRRFHLSDFSKIYAPAVDEQELANSVVLTMASKAGSTIQCACEDSMAQRQLLHLLSSYHQAWLNA